MPSLIEKYLDKLYMVEVSEIRKQLKAFALEIVEASLPEMDEDLTGNTTMMVRSTGWNDCRSAVLENAKKLINE